MISFIERVFLESEALISEKTRLKLNSGEPDFILPNGNASVELRKVNLAIEHPHMNRFGR